MAVHKHEMYRIENISDHHDREVKAVSCKCLARLKVGTEQCMHARYSAKQLTQFEIVRLISGRESAFLYGGRHELPRSTL